MLKCSITRRHLLKGATAASIGAIGFPYIIPASVLGKGGSVAPGNRITIGSIGLGGKGTHNMTKFLEKPESQVVALCDVDQGTKTYYGGGDYGLGPAKKKADEHYAKQKGTVKYNGPATYSDFRELLADKSIDAVCISTPDHWHGLISIAAANAGKDIYCEKPLVNTIAEGRAVCNAVKKNKRVFQTGSHERSNPDGRYACELVRNGRIGKLHTIHITMPFKESHLQKVMNWTEEQPPMPVPDGFDYNFWLGPAAEAAYTLNRCHFWWRFILDYGGGEMTDRGAHILDIAQFGGGYDDTGPIKLKARGVQPKSGLYNTFMNFSFECEYADGVRMIGTNEEPRGIKFIGDKGWVFVGIHNCILSAEPASLLNEKIGDDEIHLGRTTDHHQNFLDAIKTRGQTFAPAEVGHRTATLCHLLNISMLTESPLAWDPKAEQITNNDQANKMLARTMRKPWHL